MSAFNERRVQDVQRLRQLAEQAPTRLKIGRVSGTPPNQIDIELHFKTAPSRPRVLVMESVMAGVLAHLKEQRIEMGGLLLGTVYEGLSGGDDFVVGITNFARSIDFDGTSVSLRMDPDVWERARASADGTTVVGWYHSHPDLGVFFSGTDRRTQRSFFN